MLLENGCQFRAAKSRLSRSWEPPAFLATNQISGCTLLCRHCTPVSKWWATLWVGRVASSYHPLALVAFDGSSPIISHWGLAWWTSENAKSLSLKAARKPGWNSPTLRGERRNNNNNNNNNNKGLENKVCKESSYTRFGKTVDILRESFWASRQIQTNRKWYGIDLSTRTLT